jgi:hypothetical protein
MGCKLETPLAQATLLGAWLAVLLSVACFESGLRFFDHGRVRARVPPHITKHHTVHAYIHILHDQVGSPNLALGVASICGALLAQVPVPFNTGCLPLSYSGNPGANDESDRGQTGNVVGSGCAAGVPLRRGGRQPSAHAARPPAPSHVCPHC